MSRVHDVIIAGAGPIGLFLACELALANVSVIMIERDAQLESPWKEKALGMRGLNTVSLDAFYRRGLLEKVVDVDDKRPKWFQQKPGFQFGGHFAGILLNANKLDMSRHKYRLPGPTLIPGPSYMERIEKSLTERAESLGVTILRGTGVANVTQDDDEVKVQAGSRTFRTKWLVGCDGGRSTVRRAAGFDFVGTEPEFTGYAFTADLDDPEKLKPGFNFGNGGMHIVGHDKNFFLVDFEDAAFDRTKEPTREHLQAVLARVTGTDVGISKLHHASSFTDRSKQATTYRKGRVLLAGDAAHIHSPLGAQGLNLGLGDAMNMGWKLAATIHASRSAGDAAADLALLDTYEKERHPLGAWVLEWTRAQVTTMRPDRFGSAIRNLVQDLLSTADGTNLVIDRVWGLSLRYDLGDAHPLVGCSAPDFELDDGTKLGVKFLGGRGLLVSFEDDAALKKLAGAYEGKVDYVGVGAKEQLGIRALVIRPDGFVAWVAEEKPDVDAAKAVLERWFGPASK